MSAPVVVPRVPQNTDSDKKHTLTTAEKLFLPTIMATMLIVEAPKISAATRVIKNIPWTQGRSLGELAYPPSKDWQLQQLRPVSPEMTALGATILFAAGLAKMARSFACGRLLHFGAGVAVASVGLATLVTYIPARLGALSILIGVPGYFVCCVVADQMDQYAIRKLRQRFERLNLKEERERPKREARMARSQSKYRARLNRMNAKFGLPPL